MIYVKIFIAAIIVVVLFLSVAGAALFIIVLICDDASPNFDGEDQDGIVDDRNSFND